MTPPAHNDNKPPLPPPDRTFTKPGCGWCEVVFGWLIIAIVCLLIWAGITYYQR